ATLVPVRPTGWPDGTQPKSVTARVAPTAPPSTVATSSTRCQCSRPPTPSPPATTTLASRSRGPAGPPSLLSSSTRARGATGGASRAPIRPAAPGVAASYAPARIVAICGAPCTTYSATTLPPYTGFVITTRPSPTPRRMQSVTSPVRRLAASRATHSRAFRVCGNRAAAGEHALSIASLAATYASHTYGS